MTDYDKGHAHTYGKGSYNINKMATVPGNRKSTHEPSESGSVENNNSHQLSGIESSTRTYQSNHVAQADIMRARNQYNYVRTNAELHQAAPAADSMCTDDKLDAMDDDDILAVGPFNS